MPRIYDEETIIIAGGGGVVANVVWGPQFGEQEENIIGVQVSLGDSFALDGTRTVGIQHRFDTAEIIYADQNVGMHAFTDEFGPGWDIAPVGAQVSFPEAAVDYSQVAGATVTFPAADVSYERSLGQEVAFPEAALDSTRTVGIQNSGDLAFDHLSPIASVGTQVTFPAAAIDNTRGVGTTLTLPSLAADYSPRITGVSIPSILIESTSIRVNHDTYVDEVAGCVGESNHNGVDMQVEGVVATRKDAYIQFETSQLVPAGQQITLLAASVFIEVSLGPIATNASGNVEIDDTGTAWNETTLVCSTAPPAGSSYGSPQPYTVTTGFTGQLEIDITSTAAGITDIETVLENQRDLNVRFIAAAAAGQWRMDSKDSGVRPFLSLRYQVTNP